MQAWEEFVNRIEQEVGKETSKTWLRSLRVHRFDAQNLYLEAKDTFQVLWFEEHVRQKARKLLLTNSQKPIKIHLQVGSAPNLTHQKRRATRQPKKAVSPTHNYNFDPLDPTCNFSSLHIHEGNLLATKLFRQILKYDPETLTFSPTLSQPLEFNPIYLYGPPGSGKTHLLMAAAHIYQKAGIKALYSRAETFTEHLVSAIRSGEMSQFRQMWRSCDVLLMDNIDIISKKGATQEEFFHTFNSLHLPGKQIILTSAVSPQELKAVEPRLVSRFEWGLVAPLKQPTSSEIPALLRKKEEALNFPLPPKVASFLLETFQSSPKNLIEALSALMLRLHIDKKNLSQTLSSFSTTSLRKILNDLIEKEDKSSITPAKVIHTVADQFGIRVEDILSKAQSRDCVFPRQLAMYLCRQILKLPYTHIGETFSRDHSTVMSAIKQVQKQVDAQNSNVISSLHSLSKKL